MLCIELTKQEHLNLGTCLFLITNQASREHASVVKHKEVALVEVIQNFLENAMFYLTRLAVQYHHWHLIAHCAWMLSYQLLWQIKIKFR